MTDIQTLTNYNIHIYERFKDLKQSGKNNYDNNDLWKIFEYFSCIKLSEKYNQQFYEYDDIDPTFKEVNQMSQNDTGIDACNLIDTIVQCKLRKDTLSWKDCATFFGSQVLFCEKQNKPVVRWDNLIITRNEDCDLSKNLLNRKKLFTDITFSKKQLIEYCENLIINPPKYPQLICNFKLRDYQIEAINLIKNSKGNNIICIPTGTGKNVIIIHSFVDGLKYLILVPRIILMEQLKNEIIKMIPNLKTKIQLIGDGNNNFDPNKSITICVFNSVHIIEKYAGTFEKIFVDEAHHINIPEIYTIDNDEDESNGELIDDIEDEVKETSNYVQITKGFTKYNNNVYLSTTIDAQQGFGYYKKEIRDMIDKKYLCDYTVHIPIFNDDPTNKNICEYLLGKYRNIIVYCNSQKEGVAINKLFNKLRDGSSEYIDCNTSKLSRNSIIRRYKEGKIPFLINVKILVEGFDAPISNGVCFMHLPKSNVTLIQIIGRALRLHPLKKIAHIILPYSTRDDGDNINNFLKVIARNDSRVRESYLNKTIGGYISIEKNDEVDEEEEENNIELRYELIYDSMGKLNNRDDIWRMKRDLLFEYCNIDKCVPTNKTIYKNQLIGLWLQNQKKMIINNKISKKYIELSENIYVKQSLDDYLIYLNKNKDNEKLVWDEWKILLFEYCNVNKNVPSKRTKYKNQFIGQWLQHQKKKIDNVNSNIYINLSENVYVKQSLDDYLKYLDKNKDKEKIGWDNWKTLLFEFCNINKIVPTKKIKYKNQLIGNWLQHQKKKIDNVNSNIYINLSENVYVKQSLDDYLIYLNKNKNKEKLEWNDWKTLLFEYCNINKIVPTKKTLYKNQLIGQWLQEQKKKINDVNSDIYIKLSENIYVKKSLDDYLNPDNNWNNWKALLFEYCDINKAVPSNRTIYKNKLICKWLQHQKSKINNVNSNIYIKLSENLYVKQSLDNYLIYLNKNKNKIKQ